MSTAAHQLLASFDALAESDQREVAKEILRRVVSAGAGDLPEETLIETANEVFRTLDHEEAK